MKMSLILVTTLTSLLLGCRVSDPAEQVITNSVSVVNVAYETNTTYVTITTTETVVHTVFATNLVEQFSVVQNWLVNKPVSRHYEWSPNLLVVASNQHCVVALLNGPTTIVAPDATGIPDGTTMRFRLSADNSDRTVTWAPAFVIPSSSNMSRTDSVRANTTSVYAAEYCAANGTWLLQAYVWGY